MGGHILLCYCYASVGVCWYAYMHTKLLGSVYEHMECERTFINHDTLITEYNYLRAGELSELSLPANNASERCLLAESIRVGVPFVCVLACVLSSALTIRKIVLEQILCAVAVMCGLR